MRPQRTFVYVGKAKAAAKSAKRGRPTPSGDKVIAFVKQAIDAGQPLPTTTMVQRHMGWKTRSVAADCMRQLYLRGRLPEDYEPILWRRFGKRAA